jgi:hypothetical protein
VRKPKDALVLLLMMLLNLMVCTLILSSSDFFYYFYFLFFIFLWRLRSIFSFLLSAQSQLTLPVETIQQMKRLINEPSLNKPLTAFPKNVTTEFDRIELLCSAAYEYASVSRKNRMNDLFCI